MDRRNFIKFTTATGASGALAGCGNPENHLVRFVPEEVIHPGTAEWKPSVCPLCSAGCGVLVRVMDGDAEVIRNGESGVIERGLAKKLEGNPAHPINQGRLCVRGQAAIQLAYHPDRILRPMKRTGERGSGQYHEISWDDAISEVVGKLDALAAANNQKALTVVTRPVRGQRQFLLSEFLRRFGAPGPFEFETFDDSVLRRANARSFAVEQLPTFDFAHSRYVLSFGADFLGTWNSPVSQSVGYGEMRQGRSGVRGKLVQIEPRMSQTGANADEWIPARPGTEGVLALGLAHIIIQEGLRPAAAAGRAGDQIDGWAQGLQAWSPSEVEKRTGVAASRIERLAREFAESRPAVAVIAGAALAHTNGLFHALAVNALNALVGSFGEAGGLSFMPQAAEPASLTQRLRKLPSDVQVLFLHDANPVYGAPTSWRVKESLRQIPFIVSFGSFLDDTSVFADVILPDHTFLESWVDHVPEAGGLAPLASVAPPAIRPLGDTRAMPDVVLDIAGRLKRPLNPAFAWKTYRDVLENAFTSAGADWTASIQQGFVTVGAVSDRALFPNGGHSPGPGKSARSETAPTVFTDPQFDGPSERFPFHFLPYASQQFLDGSLAHLPWLQELPDVLTTAMWSSWIEINPATAESLGIKQGDLVEVTSPHASLQAPAVLFPGIAPDMIAMPAGQGHENFTRYASKRGANPLSILGDKAEPETSSWAWASTRVRISKVGENGGLVLFAGGLREREREHR